MPSSVGRRSGFKVGSLEGGGAKYSGFRVQAGRHFGRLEVLRRAGQVTGHIIAGVPTQDYFARRPRPDQHPPCPSEWFPKFPPQGLWALLNATKFLNTCVSHMAGVWPLLPQPVTATNAGAGSCVITTTAPSTATGTGTTIER